MHLVARKTRGRMNLQRWSVTAPRPFWVKMEKRGRYSGHVEMGVRSPRHKSGRRLDARPASVINCLLGQKCVSAMTSGDSLGSEWNSKREKSIQDLHSRLGVSRTLLVNASLLYACQNFGRDILLKTAWKRTTCSGKYTFTMQIQYTQYLRECHSSWQVQHDDTFKQLQFRQCISWIPHFRSSSKSVRVKS